jgi:hypothetical protein
MQHRQNDHTLNYAVKHDMMENESHKRDQIANVLSSVWSLEHTTNEMSY